jgi:hypothetical protein
MGPKILPAEKAVPTGKVGIPGALMVWATKGLKPGAAGALGIRLEVKGPTVKPEGVAGAAMTMAPGITGAKMVPTAGKFPVIALVVVETVGIVGALNVTLRKLGIGGGPMLVKLVKLVIGKNCKLLVFSTPRRVKVAGFCCSIQYKRKTRKI